MAYHQRLPTSSKKHTPRAPYKLSPAMFTAAVEQIFKRIPSDTGININGQVLNNLRFADGNILFSNTEEQLQELMKPLNEEGKKDGMRMNEKKTKVMCNEIAKKQTSSGISLDGVKLEEVEEYKYLGKVLTPKNEISVEINQ